MNPAAHQLHNLPRWLGPGMITGIGAGAAGTAAAYLRTDGGSWATNLLAQISKHGMILGMAVLIAALAGAAVACLTARFRASTFASGVLLLSLAIGVALLREMPQQLIRMASEEDWLRLTWLLFAGIGWGSGWSLARIVCHIAPPSWGFALPFVCGIATVAGLAGSVGDLLALGWLLLFGPALGQWLWLRFPLRGNAGTPPLVVTFALGVSILSLTGFLLGVAHLAHPWMLSGAMIGLSLVAARPLASLTSAAVRLGKIPAVSSAWTAMLCGGLGAMLFGQWMGAIAPETGPDAIGGRIALPMLWLHEGALTVHPEIALSYMGMAGETLFLLFLPLAGDNAAKIVALVCLMVAVANMLQRQTNLHVGSVAVAFMFSTSTIVWWQLLHGFVDLLQAVSILGAAESIRRWLDQEDPRDAISAGVLGGMAAAVKLNGGIAVVLAIAVVFVVHLRRHHALWPALRLAGLVGIPAAVLLAPWLLRSFLLTGNPIYPFANGYFHSLDAWGTLATKRFGNPSGLEKWKTLYEVFLQPGNFAELGTYHPLLLPLTTCAILAVPWLSKPARYWLGAMALGFGFWLLTEENLRYSLFIGFFVAAFLVSAVHVVPIGKSRWQSSLLGALLVVGSFGGLIMQLARPASWMWHGSDGPALPASFALGWQTADSYLEKNLPTYPAGRYLRSQPSAGRFTVWQIPWLRDHLSFSGKVLSMPHGDNRVLKPLRDLLPDRPAGTDLEHVLQTLRVAGITHLVIDDQNPWVGNTPESAWTGLFSPVFLDAWFELNQAHRTLRLYALRDHAIKTPPPRLKLGSLPLIENHRDLAVTPNCLYEFLLPKVPPLASAGIYADQAWYDDRGVLVFFQRRPLPVTEKTAWHRWFQTAPPTAHKLRIYVHGVNPELSVEIYQRLALPRSN